MEDSPDRLSRSIALEVLGRMVEWLWSFPFGVFVELRRNSETETLLPLWDCGFLRRSDEEKPEVRYDGLSSLATVAWNSGFTNFFHDLWEDPLSVSSR